LPSLVLKPPLRSSDTTTDSQKNKYSNLTAKPSSRVTMENTKSSGIAQTPEFSASFVTHI
jgi:hypothetical protein